MIEEFNEQIALIQIDLSDIFSEMKRNLKFKKFENLKLAKVFTIFDRSEKRLYRLDYVNSVSFEIPTKFQPSLQLGEYWISDKGQWYKDYKPKSFVEYIKNRGIKFEELNTIEFGFSVLQHLKHLIKSEKDRRDIFLNSKKEYIPEAKSDEENGEAKEVEVTE